MSIEETKEIYLKQCVARMLQIKERLMQLDADTQNASEALTRSERSTQSDFLVLENKYHAAQLELFNETVEIEKDLINLGISQHTKLNQKEIIELSKQLDLAGVLHKQQHACDTDIDRVLGCNTCGLWGSCVQCVTSCGLNGGSTGCWGGGTRIAGVH